MPATVGLDLTVRDALLVRACFPFQFAERGLPLGTLVAVPSEADVVDHARLDGAVDVWLSRDLDQARTRPPIGSSLE